MNPSNIGLTYAWGSRAVEWIGLGLIAVYLIWALIWLKRTSGR